uniref:Transmembrane protein 14C n=1 Tax=Cyprinus carpio TaxID=7962 RepID=A0A8C1NAR6_CYPCA
MKSKRNSARHSGTLCRGVSTWWPGVTPAPPEIWLATPGAPSPLPRCLAIDFFLGIVGYVKAGSVMSLVAGLMFGIAAFVGAHQMSKHDKDIWVSLGTCGSLTALMGVRFLSWWKIMPAGLMAGASLLMFLRIGVKVLQNSQKKKR